MKLDTCDGTTEPDDPTLCMNTTGTIVATQPEPAKCKTVMPRTMINSSTSSLRKEVPTAPAARTGNT
ncbi:unnamed protein product [Amoebophrya sp. A25]|nr:unnamed protein product [Amoebophrya sp. A25]|eukprot:GSA25T00000268001.1